MHILPSETSFCPERSPLPCARSGSAFFMPSASSPSCSACSGWPCPSSPSLPTQAQKRLPPSRGWLHRAAPGRAARIFTSATRADGWWSTPARRTACPTSASCAPASTSTFCPRPTPSGSSRASTSPGRPPCGRSWRTSADKQKA